MTHLIVVSHGLWGTTADVQNLVNLLKAHVPNSRVLSISTNAVLNSYHGIEVCGKRVYDEVTATINNNSSSTESPFSQISFIGYSAGGLFHRYAIAMLDRDKIFERLAPRHFITVATPHLGVRRSPKEWIGRAWNKTSQVGSHVYGGRTAHQIALADADLAVGKLPLLLEMSLPASPFFQALQKFAHIRVYANVRNDNIVFYCSPAIAAKNPFRESPPPSKQYIVSEVRIDTEQDTEAPVRSASSSKLKSVGQAVGLAVVSPLLAAQLMLLIAPLRAASWLKDPGELAHHERITTTQATTSTPTPTPTQQAPPTRVGDADAAVEVEGELGAPGAGDGLGDGNVGDDDDEQDDLVQSMNEIPALIRQNLKQLPITRVSCFMPGPHTHGAIICRRTWNYHGKHVIAHICDHFLTSMDPPMQPVAQAQLQA